VPDDIPGQRQVDQLLWVASLIGPQRPPFRASAQSRLLPRDFRASGEGLHLDVVETSSMSIVEETKHG